MSGFSIGVGVGLKYTQTARTSGILPSPIPNLAYLLLEDGGIMLLEDGGKFLMEE